MKVPMTLKSLAGYVVVALGLCGLYWLRSTLTVDLDAAYANASRASSPKWENYGPTGGPIPLVIDETVETILPPGHEDYPWHEIFYRGF